MTHFPARGLWQITAPFARKGGYVVMLAAYFDDSGTHAGSDLAVWAGVIGTVEQFSWLEAEWDAILDKPLGGRKPKLKKFSVRDCKLGRGEFFGWNDGERDRMRFEAREIIAKSGVIPRAYCVPIELYNYHLNGRPRRAFGPADGLAFASCADSALQMSEMAGKKPLLCVFDKGQKSPRLDIYVSDAEARAARRDIPISYSYAPVLGTPGLQAADTIATEHYWYGMACKDALPPKIDPHFASLVRETDPHAFVMEPDQLKKMRQDFLRLYPTKDRISAGGRQIWEEIALPW